ncbi:YHS domain-containing (seleno)protein [Flavobacterium sp.]|uniref:YHS domain-containing (seleno)protein n=1 Tax=Flavobacterium sp. TaxID=239 RepID=UPI00286A793D|nr:YHS domain-containing (seleno)protein [Flavobacterium sp.]
MKKLLVLFVVLTTISIFAQSNLKNGLALQGFDPVAYFESNKAIEGKKEITSAYNGAVYQFSSESNKEIFLKNPSHYEPEFGGFCAYGMSEGYEAPVKPEAFTIVKNKLYLNYNLKVKEMWAKEQNSRIEKAIVNWEKIKNE